MDIMKYFPEYYNLFLGILGLLMLIVSIPYTLIWAVRAKSESIFARIGWGLFSILWIIILAQSVYSDTGFFSEHGPIVDKIVILTAVFACSLIGIGWYKEYKSPYSNPEERRITRIVVYSIVVCIAAIVLCIRL